MKRFFYFLIPLLLSSIPIEGFSEHDFFDAGGKLGRMVVLPAHRSKLSRKIHDIFEKVYHVADKRKNSDPSLIIVSNIDNPWIFCTSDGIVLFTEKAIEMCYHGVDKETGDARVAFFIGHEIAHLYYKEFWHLEAYLILKKHEKKGGLYSQLLKIFMQKEKILDEEEAKKGMKQQELDADSLGILYASLAGFDVSKIVDTKGKNFFTEWVNQLTKMGVYDDNSHPASEERATFLLTYLKAVIDDLYLYHFGIRLYQLKRHLDANHFLKKFIKTYPSREVYNSLGLINYELSLQYLSECDPIQAYQYKLSTLIDIETRAELLKKIKKRGVQRGIERNQDDCTELLERFKAYRKEAIKYLKNACENDVFYVPSSINLSSALIMAKDYSGSMSILDKVLKIKPDSIEAFNNYSVAQFQLGQTIKVDMAAHAINRLTKITQDHPNFSNAYYNLGQFYFERGDRDISNSYMEDFLNIESSGIYADIARNHLSKSNETINSKKQISGFNEKVPISLGKIDDKKRKTLASYQKIPLNLGVIKGACYINKNNIRILAVYKSQKTTFVEIVDCPVKKKISLSLVIEKHGQARHTYKNDRDHLTLVYDGIAFDIKDGFVDREFYFTP